MFARSCGCLLLLMVSGVNAETLRDPTRPLAYVESSSVSSGAKSSELQSILIAGNRKLAILNGKEYREGDPYKGGTVARILPGKVIVRTGSKQRTIKLNTLVVKKVK